jgi:hypothetical protein
VSEFADDAAWTVVLPDAVSHSLRSAGSSIAPDNFKT